MTTETTFKTCLRCGETKPLDDFGRYVRSHDGHACYCRACRRRIYRDAHGGLPRLLARFTTEELLEEINRRENLENEI